jgi:hypothetical protein
MTNGLIKAVKGQKSIMSGYCFDLLVNVSL